MDSGYPESRHDAEHSMIPRTRVAFIPLNKLLAHHSLPFGLYLGLASRASREVSYYAGPRLTAALPVFQTRCIYSPSLVFFSGAHLAPKQRLEITVQHYFGKITLGFLDGKGKATTTNGTGSTVVEYPLQMPSKDQT